MCTPDKIQLQFNNSLAEQTIFKQMKQRLGLLLTSKYLIIEVVFFRPPFRLLPDELKRLITYDSICFPPVVYLYLLQFFCCYHQGDYGGQLKALSNLEQTIRERYFILDDDDVLINAMKSLAIVKSLI